MRQIVSRPCAASRRNPLADIDPSGNSNCAVMWSRNIVSSVMCALSGTVILRVITETRHYHPVYEAPESHFLFRATFLAIRPAVRRSSRRESVATVACSPASARICECANARWNVRSRADRFTIMARGGRLDG